MPTADAGGDQSVTEGDTVTLDGSASSDSDGTIVSYAWELVSPDVGLTITNSDKAQASFTAPPVDSNTDYILRLTVTDNDGASDSNKATITVLDSASEIVPPVADAGSDRSVTEGDSVILDGSGSGDSDGTIVSYSWELVSPDVELTIINADQAQASFIASAVDSDTAYVFRLTVADNDQAGASDTVTITVVSANTTPGPSNLVASPSDNQVDLSWSALSGAAGYRVYRDNVIQATTGNASYTDTTALNGSSYIYSVKAYFSDNSETALSSTQVTLSPNIPASVEATASDSLVSLSWNASAGANGYRIYRDGSLRAEVSELSYQDTSASNGATYVYQLSSYNSGGESAKSSELSLTLIPDAPTNLAATTAYQEVSLSWSAASGATSYNIYRDGSEIASSDSASYTDSGLSNDNTYSYSVSAVNAGGESSASSALDVYVPISIDPEAPFLAEYNVDKNQVELSFSQQDNVSYRLIRSFESDCTLDTLLLCDGNVELNIFGTVAIDSLDFSQTQYYQLVATLNDLEHIYYAEVIGPDELDGFMQQQSLTVEYKPTTDVVSIGHASTDNTSYTLYAAYEPIGTATCSIADGIQFCTIPGDSWVDSQIPTAETVDWDKRRYYQLDVSVDGTVVGSLTADAAAADALIMNTPTVSEDDLYNLYLSWQELKNATSYTLYIAKDSTATNATAGTWEQLSEAKVITDISGASYTHHALIKTAQLALSATNTSGETTPLLHLFQIDGIQPSDGSEWLEVTDAPGWNGRNRHTSVVFDDKVWVLGGTVGRRESWYSSDGESWTMASNSSWGYDVYDHTSVAFDGKMWILGGYTGSSTGSNDYVSSSIDGVTWSVVDANADWHFRYYHSSVVFDDKMWVMGGLRYTSSYYNDVWSSSTGNPWSSNAGAPWAGRQHHTSVVFDDKMWVLGGHTSSGSVNDVWYSGDGNSWGQAAANADWSDRRWHTTLAYDDKLWVLGGYESSGDRKNDVWYSTDGADWESATSVADWDPRDRHTSVVFRDRMWVIGGYSTTDSTEQDVWASALNLDNFTFSQLQ